MMTLVSEHQFVHTWSMSWQVICSRRLVQWMDLSHSSLPIRNLLFDPTCQQ